MPDRIGSPLQDMSRCPHCGIAAPNIYVASRPQAALPRSDGGEVSFWAMYACASCGSAILAQGAPGSNVANPLIVRTIPEARGAHEDLPQQARTYLNQAYQTLAAPDASAVMAGSAVDAMLKAIGYQEGSVYRRIEQAVGDNKLTASMGEWAHSVRLGANRPRHADADAPHVSLEEARQAVDFAEALGNFLFVIAARIQRGIAEANG